MPLTNFMRLNMFNLGVVEKRKTSKSIIDVRRREFN
ncbi:hypothetical protein EHW99_2964 [Erwinia amylovora]|nr:hypothetical protein EHX00_2964 [Erwinia amylovora]QJQ59362.1 hypothetical protein EHW99_2964 [Erwinia amylovora]QJQ63061.1 hypothetical protein EHW98_2964 [Erwinia amylovora]QJQ66863.1 hypothetical protein EHW96_2964 [Erwinia amylovora]QJQ70562.1 hypothetical protein EGZ89_2964 [Erwinia amylovora]